jgi:hypothetical protein
MIDRKLQRELADDLRAKDKADLRVLRARIGAARLERGRNLKTAREQCSAARVSLRDRQRGEREQLRDIQRAQRAEGKTACELGKLTAREQGLELERQAKQRLAAERQDQRLIRRAGKPVKVRATARERAAEDDDAVRSNLPPELVPVFDVVRKKIKGSARRTRTEAFLEWAEENPDEILAVQQADADKYLRDMVKAHRELGRSVRKADRYEQSPKKLAELLAGVPF